MPKGMFQRKPRSERQDHMRIETIGDAVLYNADCLEVLPTLGPVDAVVTDPPYGMNYDTDSTRFSGMMRSGYRVPVGSEPPSPFPGGIVGDDRTFEPSPWLDFDSVILWGANHYAERLPVGSMLVWIKKDDHLFGTFLSDAEIGWRKGGHGVYCFHRNWSGFSRLQTVGRSSHPNEKPIELMAWCVAMTTGTVLDPFMGSGTTGVACANLGRRFIGIEIEERYFTIACERIRRAYEQPRLPGLEPEKMNQGELPLDPESESE